jgi:hypothetical protein
MDRRRFLLASSGLLVLASGPLLPFANAGSSPHTGAHHRMLRFDPAAGRFVAHTADRASMPGEPLRLQIEGLHSAARGGLASLQVDALFGGDPGGQWRFRAWHFDRDNRHGSSRASSFNLAPGALGGLELSFRSAPEAPLQRELCACPTLATGRYLLLIGSQPLPAIDAIAFSGDWQRPLGDAVEVDYLSLQVTPPQHLPDLSLREDLACLRAEAESATTA